MKKDGHRVKRRDYIVALLDVHIQDPCPLGLPEILIGAHVSHVSCGLVSVIPSA